VLVDAETRRLAVGDQTNAVEACVPHALDDLIGRAREHVTPIAGEFDGRREERWSGLDRGRKWRHGCVARCLIVHQRQGRVIQACGC
jgi:hypothetical protein